MSWEDDDNDNGFDFNDDLSDEEKAEYEKERKEKDKYLKNHPLFKQANEILDTVTALSESIKNADEKEYYSRILIESAMMLAPKIAGAIGSESWLLSMQNAALIRYHAEYLLTSTSGLTMISDVDKSYVKLLREDMIKFRELFNEWVKELDKLEDEDYEDEWGLFRRKK